MNEMWPYAFIPVAVAIIGASWTSFSQPQPKVIGAIQHFAAGVIFYAAAGELLPDATRDGGIWTILLGGGIGIGAMLLLRRLTEGGEKGPTGLLAASAIDALVDGLVLGLGFNAGERQGTLLAIALAIEFLFLGLSISGAFGKGSGRWTVIGFTTGVSLAVPLGVLVAQPIGGLPTIWQTAAFAFGLIALLYLVTEELLTEAHENPQTAWGAASFFVGFLVMTVIGQII